MYFMDIVDYISYIIIEYYVEYRDLHNNGKAKKNFNVLVKKYHSYVKSKLIDLCMNSYDENFEVYSIDVLDFPNEKNYHFGYISEPDHTHMTTSVLYDIIDVLRSYLKDNKYISNNIEVISINTCPFDGLSIRHNFIMSILDIFFY